MTVDPAKVLATLSALKAALESESSRHAADRQPVELDQQSVGRLSRMDALQVQAMAEATERRRRQQIVRIEAALARLEAGGYGECTRCGEPIEPRRLALDPAIPTCRACADS